MLKRMVYPGGKNGAGVYQTIINLMPPHAVYIEPFFGGGAIMRQKRPAALNIGVDLDPVVVSQSQSSIAGSDDGLGPAAGIVKSAETTPAGSIAGNGDARSRFRFQRGDGIAFLASYPFTGAELVYCDPPYMHETRGRTDLYRFEMDDRQHAALLKVIKTLPCRVMISGYWTRRYDAALKDWNSVTFQAMTRGGRPATEWLWFNFPEPVALHDYRYLGEDFRARERIKRKKQRWVNRLQTMPTLERRALLCAIGEAWQLAPVETAMEDSACSIAANGEELPSPTIPDGQRPSSSLLTVRESSITVYGEREGLSRSTLDGLYTHDIGCDLSSSINGFQRKQSARRHLRE